MMRETCSKQEGKGSASSVLVGNRKGRRPFGSPRHRRKDNIKIDNK
jgi:hypothetical protein